MNHNMQMQRNRKILHRKFWSGKYRLIIDGSSLSLLLMFIVSNLYQLPAEYAFI